MGKDFGFVCVSVLSVKLLRLQVSGLPKDTSKKLLYLGTGGEIIGGYSTGGYFCMRKQWLASTDTVTAPEGQLLA